MHSTREKEFSPLAAPRLLSKDFLDASSGLFYVLALFLYTSKLTLNKKDLCIKTHYSSHLLVYRVWQSPKTIVVSHDPLSEGIWRAGGRGKHNTSHSGLDGQGSEQCNVTHVEAFKWGLWELRANDLCERNTGLGSLRTPMPIHVTGKKVTSQWVAMKPD